MDIGKPLGSFRTGALASLILMHDAKVAAEKEPFAGLQPFLTPCSLTQMEGRDRMGDGLTRAQRQHIDSLALAEHTVKEAHSYRRSVVAKARAAGISSETIKAVREATHD